MSAEHFRDFLNPQMDPFAAPVLEPNHTPLHKAWSRTAPHIMRTVIGAELVEQDGGVQYWQVGKGDITAVMEVRDERALPAILRYSDVGLFYARTGDDEALIAPSVEGTPVRPDVRTGYPKSDAMVGMLEALYVATDRLRGWNRRAAQVMAPFRDRRAQRQWQMSTERTKEEIGTHYDLTQDAYIGRRGFIDQRFVQYSSGLLLPGQKEADLETLQEQKIQSLIDQLELDTGKPLRLLEVGGGWGGLAVEIAKRAPNVQIDSLTVSDQQLRLARERAEAAGVDDRVTFIGEDYRDIEPEKPYDRIVSVEMIEAVDWRDLGVYFDKLVEFVDPHKGIIVIQSINIDESHYAQHRHNKSFANTAIFPGGALAPKEELMRRMDARGWRTAQDTDLTEGYNRTLNHWRRRFQKHLPALGERWAYEGIDPAKIGRFARGFDFYLAACEAGFGPVAQNIQCSQLAFKPQPRTVRPV